MVHLCIYTLTRLVTKIAAMGPYEESEAIESISFMKESDKYSLHQILWDNEDHLSNAIIAMRYVCCTPILYPENLFLIPGLSASMTRHGTNQCRNLKLF